MIIYDYCQTVIVVLHNLYIHKITIIIRSSIQYMHSYHDDNIRRTFVGHDNVCRTVRCLIYT